MLLIDGYSTRTAGFCSERVFLSRICLFVKGIKEIFETNSTKYDLDLITAVPSNIKALLYYYVRLLDLLQNIH